LTARLPKGGRLAELPTAAHGGPTESPQVHPLPVIPTETPPEKRKVGGSTRAEVAVGLLNDHLHHCVRDAAHRSAAEGDEVLDGVTGTIRQVIRL